MFSMSAPPPFSPPCWGNPGTCWFAPPLFPDAQQLQAQALAQAQAQVEAQAQVQALMQMKTTGIPVQTPSTWTVPGNVWRLSRDPQGCRLVQGALEDASSDSALTNLASELRGHIREATRCRHANHVVQKCITTLRPQAMKFIVEEIMERGPGTICQIARHEFGCRILQRLLEYCQPEQVKGLVGHLLAEAIALSKHVYGNYVMQHVLEHGSPDHRHRLTMILKENAQDLAFENSAQAVMVKALCHGTPEDQIQLARALICNAVLVVMSKSRHGSTAVKLVLNIVDGVDLDEATRQLSQEVVSLKTTRYGRVVMTCLDPSSPSFAAG